MVIYILNQTEGGNGYYMEYISYFSPQRFTIRYLAPLSSNYDQRESPQRLGYCLSYETVDLADEFLGFGQFGVVEQNQVFSILSIAKVQELYLQPAA